MFSEANGETAGKTNGEDGMEGEMVGSQSHLGKRNLVSWTALLSYHLPTEF